MDLDTYHQLADVIRRSGNLSDQEIIALSTAVSLKRIADALDGTTAGLDISESLCGGRPNQFRMP